MLGIGLSLTGRLRSSVSIFSPVSLFSSNEPGIWLDPSDVANLAWRRNLLTFTEQFDNAAWVKSLSTITANATAAPDGTITADKIVGSLSTTVARETSQIVAKPASAITYTASAYFKASDTNFIVLTVFDGASVFNRQWFNLQDGTLGSTAIGGGGFAGGITSVIVDAGGGWWRCSVSFTSNTATAISTFFTPTTANAVLAPANGVAVGAFIWGAQLELGSVATDYQRISDVNTEVIERFPSATLYQDTTGTLPVTTPGQTVALALDKSKGLVLGSEQIVNGSFGADTNWTKINGATISGGVATLFNAATTPAITQTRGFALGRTYKVSLTWTGTISAGIGAFGSGDIRFLTSSTLGSWTGYVTLSAGTGADFWVSAPANVTSTVDNISVKELPGFHATQATLASRPTYGIVPLSGRRNLLTRTEEFENAVWTRQNLLAFGSGSTINSAVAPDGTTTGDRIVETNDGVTPTTHSINSTTSLTAGVQYVFSFYAKGASSGRYIWVGGGGIGVAAEYPIFDVTGGTVDLAATTTVVKAATITPPDTNGWRRCSVTFVPTATTAASIGLTASATDNANVNYVGNGTSGVDLWGAQLETGSSATAYQRVGSAFDVTEAGVASLSYLSFDGVDDFLITPTITPGIDKAQVFAGVRKLSDAATGMLIEASANSGSNFGAFNITAPNGTGYGWRSGGSATADVVVSSGYPAPISNVLTGLGDIAGDVSRLRINGTQVGQTLTDQGTGNYLAYPLYIGRRGGTTLPFNGQIYSLLVRFGTNLDAGTITSTETWVGGKTGVTL